MKRPYLLFIVVAFGSLFLDQITKWWAVQNLLPLRQANPYQFRFDEFAVLKDYFHFSYAENPGATFSFLAGFPAWVRLPFFSTIAALASIWICYYYTTVKGRKLATRIALGLLWSGAVGNLIDRLRYTYVVDFIDWHYGDFTWPTFNIADVSIVIGIALFFLWGKTDEDDLKELQKKPAVLPQANPA
jgi:signal peptidase II